MLCKGLGVSGCFFFYPPRRNYYTSCDNVGQKNTFFILKRKNILMSRLSKQIEPFGAGIFFHVI